MQAAEIRTFLATLVDDAGVSLQPSTLEHALLTRSNGRAWRNGLSGLSFVKVIWLALPLQALNKNTADLRPALRSMADSLYGVGAWDDRDLVKLRVVVKRIRSYVVHGRRTNRLSRVEFAQLLRSQSRRCALCGYGFSPDDIDAREYLGEPGFNAQAKGLRPPHVDHRVPVFLGGDHDKNLQLLCHVCNLSKGATIEWFASRANLGAVKPSDLLSVTRSERWAVLSRDGACSVCSTSPCELEGANELEIARTDTSRGWLLENLEAVCRTCAAGTSRTVESAWSAVEENDQQT